MPVTHGVAGSSPVRTAEKGGDASALPLFVFVLCGGVVRQEEAASACSAKFHFEVAAV